MRSVLFIALIIPSFSFAQQDTVITSNFLYYSKNISSKDNVHVVFVDTIEHRIVFEGDYLKNEKNGVWLVYGKSGGINMQENYKNGLKDGVWYSRYQNGVFERKERYLNGNLVDSACYNEKGEKIPYFEKALTYADKMPQSKYNVQEYISNHIHYPDGSRNAGIGGTVVVGFVVKKDGSILNPKIIKGLDSARNQEALRLITNMRPWKPGMSGGKNVNVNMNVPVYFKL